jgi:hypothetical protein
LLEAISFTLRSSIVIKLIIPPVLKILAITDMSKESGATASIGGIIEGANPIGEAGMANRIVDALSGEVVFYSNSLATVTRNSVVLRDAEARSQTILSLSRITQVKKITTTYPFLLVIATASLVIAAAAASSREGGGAGIPFAVLGILLLAGYFLSRRGSVLFVAGSEILETVAGTPAEAAALIAAIASVQTVAGEEQVVWSSAHGAR